MSREIFSVERIQEKISELWLIDYNVEYGKETFILFSFMLINRRFIRMRHKA